MMATVGYLIGESTPTIVYGFEIPHTIANNQIPEIPGTVLFPFFLLINIAEAYRANRGWVEPGLGPLFTLRESYYPGDLGFDVRSSCSRGKSVVSMPSLISHVCFFVLS